MSANEHLSPHQFAYTDDEEHLLGTTVSAPGVGRTAQPTRDHLAFAMSAAKEKVLPPTHPLLATQDHLQHDKVTDMVDPKMRTFADTDQGAPPVVVHYKGQDHIFDGHHRIVSDRLTGRATRVLYQH